MKAEALALVEPEGSSGSRHMARRILAAAVLGFAMIVVLGGRARADVLDPAQSVAEPVTDVVGQAVDAATDAADPIAGTATGTVDAIVGTATDVVDPVVDRLGQLRRTAEAVLPGGRGVVGHGPALPRPPISHGSPPTLETPPAPQAEPSRSSTGWVGRVAGMGSTTPPPYLVHPRSQTDGASPSGAPPLHRGPFLPFGPFGGGLDHGQLLLLVLLGAIVASLTVRPPPIRSLLAPSVVAPNGAVLALSVERPG